jgi:hypothetical protein
LSPFHNSEASITDMNVSRHSNFFVRIDYWRRTGHGNDPFRKSHAILKLSSIVVRLLPTTLCLRTLSLDPGGLALAQPAPCRTLSLHIW